MPRESVFDSATQPAHFDPAALRHDLFDSTPALLNVLRTFDPWLADMRGKLRDAITAADTRRQLHAAIGNAKVEQVEHVAHRLRGALAQLRAAPAVARVKAIEAYGKAHPETGLPPGHDLLVALDTELDALAIEIAAQLEALRR